MKSVLVIEDNTDVRENICELLTLEGYAVLFADNAANGITLAKENAPDIIFCDIHMPDQDGYGVLRALKDNDGTANIPFVFLSASVEKKNIEAALDMGAEGYIQKPFDPLELFNAIDKYLP